MHFHCFFISLIFTISFLNFVFVPCILYIRIRCSAFSPNSIGRSTTTTRSFLKYETKLNIQTPENGDNDNITDRRKALSSIATATATATATILATTSVANAVDDDLTRGGVQLTPFNGLTFNYRGGTTNNGLDASTLNEPSIPYVDFLKRLDNDEVEFVEFLAPNGDAAYVTFKAVDGEDEKMKPIRIGEGYPIEDPEGYVLHTVWHMCISSKCRCGYEY